MFSTYFIHPGMNFGQPSCSDGAGASVPAWHVQRSVDTARTAALSEVHAEVVVTFYRMLFQQEPLEWVILLVCSYLVT